MRRLASVSALVLVAGCAATPVATPRAVATLSPPMRPVGLERVLGQDAGALNALFGQPDQDAREDGARRLQFAGPICILDAYLYAAGAGRPAVVTYVDARQPDGRDIDRASCVAALTRRQQAR
ncbi:MAG: hypothetical protein H0X36_04520 [Sphingomonadaceae bacterium]|nr:hypothetical protein [Sphingomonadaceae bacterium]